MRPSLPRKVAAISILMGMKNFSRGSFILLVGIGLTLFWPSSLCAASSLPDSATPTAIQRMTGLDRHYDLSFLWFDRLAIGQLSFTQDPLKPKRFRALLEARTLGVAAWLTGDRVQRYESLMEIGPQGRLQPLEYQSMIHKKKGGTVTKQTKLYTFNAATRTIMMTRSKGGINGIEKPIKVLGDRFPVDFLTAGFNFISGSDGPIRAGERKEILTFTDKGEQEIVIEVLGAEQWPTTSFFKKGQGTLLKITLPREILDTGGGAVYALLDENVLPQRTIIENVLGLGDVRGELRP